MNSLSLTKKENKKDLKRKKIIESASLLFSRKSYHEVMVEDVAKLASIAKGSVYNYFKSKEELYFSIMKMRMEKLTVSLKEKIKSELNSIDSLHSFVIHLYMFMMKYQSFFLMYRKESLKAEHELCAELIEMEKDLQNILSAIICSGKDKEQFRNIDEGFAVELILGSIYGAVHRGIENNFSEEVIESEREIIFDFILNGLSSTNNKNMLPLKGKTIVITRSVDQSEESGEKFKRLGADVIPFPTLEIIPPDSWQQFDEIITSSEKIDFLIFTSANAVKMFIKRCEELSVHFNFDKVVVVSIGNKTAAACHKNKIPVQIIPKDFSSKGVIDELNKYDLKDKLIFIPRSAIGREELPNGLAYLGAKVKTTPVYNVVLPSKEKIMALLEKLEVGKPDLFIFTSPSTFENFIKILNINNPQNYFSEYDIAVIGPTTKSAIEEKGVKVNILPKEFTIDGLERAIIKYYSAI